MEDSKVLTPEEVSALLKATQEKTRDLTQLINSNSSGKWGESSYTLNSKALTTIAEVCWAECGNILSSFLKKKITIKSKQQPRFDRLSECLEGRMEKHIYSIFQITPSNQYAMVVMDLPFLHQAINLLYGGHTDNEPVIEIPGKIGVIIAEKLGQLAMDSFVQACREFGNISFEKFKTVTMPNLISKLGMNDRVYSMDWTILIDEVETSFNIIIAESFFHEFIPDHSLETTGSDKNSWRTAIESQVVDSYVTVKVSLPDVKIKMSELTALKNGDLIPIGEPTLVYVCLNNLKLFRANAGQANANRVVKILSEI